MKWLLNLSIRAKLFLGFGLMIVLFIIAIVRAYMSITEIYESQKKIYEEDFADIEDALLLRVNQNGARADVLTMLSIPNQSDRNMRYEDIKRRTNDIDETLKRLFERNRNNQEILNLLEKYNTIRNSYAQTRESEVIPLIFAGKSEEAKKIIFGIQYERYQNLRSITEELGKRVDMDAQNQMTLSTETAKDSVRVFGIIGCIVFLFGVVISVVFSKIIANPLRQISTVAERVASGDLTVNVRADARKDEVGTLEQTFRKMVENLRGMNREIIEGVNVLTSSVGEIMATMAQVASGTSETATAISQTTTTIEEVRQTAQVSGQKAKYVSESAQKTSQVSQNGKKSIEELIAGMDRIRQQIESIAETIIRLSEQSQAIGEIIAVVNDLAEQSNLLAVNAAIEAAKAGEQGKGFSVVAQEIKNLAEQSKQATTQVRSILMDVQKAISTSVMATEQGSKAVEAGVMQSTEASTSIRMLVDSITESAQAATQVAASSQQQLVGMDQVTMAMENIKQASSQNMASTKQTETAAHNLNELGQKLKQLMERFKM